jgi:hypothetical protein
MVDTLLTPLEENLNDTWSVTDCAKDGNSLKHFDGVFF